ncbi:MAG TPA: hypothetical protein VL025_01005 [Thermoanaerobaculia bacterium]|nr:hypothetical protein [Thermoanaerobaculia bacterium]
MLLSLDIGRWYPLPEEEGKAGLKDIKDSKDLKDIKDFEGELSSRCPWSP